MDTTAEQTVIDTLNAYEGDNIWQDVVLNIPGYDEDATEAIDPSGASDRFVAGGVTYRHEASRGAWDVVSGVVAAVTEINQQTPAGFFDTVTVTTPEGVVTQIMLESSEEEEPYDEAVRSLGFTDFTWGPGVG